LDTATDRQDRPLKFFYAIGIAKGRMGAVFVIISRGQLPIRNTNAIAVPKAALNADLGTFTQHIYFG
jgi:hypothetical protein